MKFPENYVDDVILWRDKDMDVYQKAAKFFLRIPKGEDRLSFLALGMCSEVGEVAGKLYKAARDGIDVDLDHLSKEVGDVKWFVAVLADEIGKELSQIAFDNIVKLEDRRKRGVEQGDGDNR